MGLDPDVFILKITIRSLSFPGLPGHAWWKKKDVHSFLPAE